MTAEEELRTLKLALTDWASAKTYEDGCKFWKRIEKIMGWRK